jgi:NADPH:quinone reductase-like Zn-dependent oxidoreductase
MLITAEEAVKTAFTMLIVLGMAYFAAAQVLAAPAPIATTTRKVVLEKLETGAYRWKLMEAPIRGVGDHQVLVHVRAVALNRGDLEMLDPDERRDRSGLVVASDAAGDVVAVGKQVQGIRKGARVTSLYFSNYVDSPPTRAKLSGAHGARDGINYTSTPAWADRVRELTDDHGADVIVDAGGKDTLEQSTKCLAYSGTLSIVGGLSGYGGSIPSLGLLAKAARAQGVFVGKIVIRL